MKKEILEDTMYGTIQALYRGKPKKLMDHKGKEYISGIQKEEVEYLTVTKEIIDGDDVANKTFHGGLDRVICVYPIERYAFFEDEYKKPLPKCSFGENMTVTGLLEDEVYVGDIFQIGEVIVQISEGRMPCHTIEKRTGFEHLLKRIFETGFTGYFFRIIKEGTIKKDDKVHLIDRKQNQFTVMDLHHLFFNEKYNLEKMKRAIDIKELSESWKSALKKRIK